MKLLIVGASGFIGSHLLRIAEAAGHTALGTRASAADPKLPRFDLRSDRIGDCLPAGFLDDEDTHVVICASICQIDRCYHDREASRLVNVERTIRLIDDVADRTGRIVFLSTSHVFDGETGEYCETDPTGPVTEYGRQKLAVEDDLLANVSNALILRLDKVVGDRPGERHLFDEWWSAIQQRQPIRCIAGQVISPTLVNDVVAAILIGCEQNLSGLFHVSAPESLSRTELAERFVHAAGATVDVVSKPLEAFGFADRRPLRTSLDARKFATETAFSFTTLGDGIDRFLRAAGS